MSFEILFVFSVSIPRIFCETDSQTYVEVFVDVQYLEAEIVRDHRKAAAALDGTAQPEMVSLGKLHFITFGVVIRRVAVEERIRAVILRQQTLKVLVLYDHVFEPAGTSPYICEEVPYIAGLSAE